MYYPGSACWGTDLPSGRLLYIHIYRPICIYIYIYIYYFKSITIVIEISLRPCGLKHTQQFLKMIDPLFGVIDISLPPRVSRTEFSAHTHTHTDTHTQTHRHDTHRHTQKHLFDTILPTKDHRTTPHSHRTISSQVATQRRSRHHELQFNVQTTRLMKCHTSMKQLSRKNLWVLYSGLS